MSTMSIFIHILLCLLSISDRLLENMNIGDIEMCMGKYEIKNCKTPHRAYFFMYRSNEVSYDEDFQVFLTKVILP